MSHAQYRTLSVIMAIAVAMAFACICAWQAHAVTISDEVMRGSVTMRMVDDDWLTADPQGNASFAGKKYTVYNKSAAQVVVGGKVYAVNAAIATVTSDSNGVATLKDLPYGTYEIRQDTAPTGYSKNGTWSKTVQIRSNGQNVDIGVSGAVPDAIWRGSVKMLKVDNQMNEAHGEGDASLAGATFTIYNKSLHSVYVHGKTYAVNAAVGTCTTDAAGAASFDDLPYGTYLVKETGTPTGYLLNSSWSRTFSVTSNGQVVDITADTCKDEVWRGSVVVRKQDDDWQRSDPQGDAMFKGAVFTIVNRSAYDVVSHGKRVKPGEVVGTCTVPDDTGVTSFDDLPYGTYEVTETTPPTGYLLDTEWSRTFAIRTDGQVVDLKGQPASDPVVRGGGLVRKLDATTVMSSALGDGGLEGAVFGVYNISLHDVYRDGTTYRTGRKADGSYELSEASRVGGLSTDEWGQIVFPVDWLPYGTYVLVEEAPPEGYLVNETFAKGVVFEVRANGVFADIHE